MKEIERKFLVKNDAWKKDAKHPWLYKQFYIQEKNPNIRIRLINDFDDFFTSILGRLTIKYATNSPIIRNEYEFNFESTSDNLEKLIILAKKINFGVIKKRWLIKYKDFTWEVDEYQGKNKGLVTADLELKDPNQKIEFPDWVGEEITGNPKYSNYNLSHKIYKRKD